MLKKGTGMCRLVLILSIAVAAWTSPAFAKGPTGGGGAEGGPNISVCYKGVSGPAMVGKLTLTEYVENGPYYKLMFEGICKNTRYFRYVEENRFLGEGKTFQDVVKSCNASQDCQGKLPVQGFIFEADYAGITLADGSETTLPAVGCVPQSYQNPWTIIRLYVESALTMTTVLNENGTKTIESDVVLLFLVPYDSAPPGEDCGY